MLENTSKQQHGWEKKRSWDKDTLKTALDKIMSKQISLKEPSTKYGIPKNTLHDIVASLKAGKEIELESRETMKTTRKI